MTGSSDQYGLPSSEAERERLRLQAERQADNTLSFLTGAGVGTGLRVLDVGTGLGDLALVAARLVGTTGYVLGIDNDPAQIERAQERAHEDGLGNVEFAVSDIYALEPPPTPFDAVIGRFVLMWQRDPLAALQSVTAQVREGGVVAFWEASYPLHLAGVEDSWFSWPPSPPLNRLRQVLYRAMQAVGVQPMMGHRLVSCFFDAGLSVSEVGSPTLVTVGEEAAGPLFQFARSLVDRAATLGVLGDPDVDIDQLELDFRASPDAKQLVVAPLAPVLTAWGRKPSK